MKEYIFVRHGQSQYNAGFTRNLDSDLTDIGIKQATETSKYLLENIPNISEFYGVVSPYHRCLQTAKIIHDITGLSFQVKTFPREDMTTYDECKVVNRKDIFDTFHWDEDHQEDFHFTNESLDDFFLRMENYIQNKENRLKTIIVSHANPIKFMHHIVLGNKLENILDIHYPKNCSVSHIKNKESVLWNHIPWDVSLLEEQAQKLMDDISNILPDLR